MRIELNKVSNSFEVFELTNTKEIVYEGKDIMDRDAGKELLFATAGAVYEICRALSEQTENQYRKRDLRDAAERLNGKMFNFSTEM